MKNKWERVEGEVWEGRGMEKTKAKQKNKTKKPQTIENTKLGG